MNPKYPPLFYQNCNSQNIQSRKVTIGRHASKYFINKVIINLAVLKGRHSDVTKCLSLDALDILFFKLTYLCIAVNGCREVSSMESRIALLLRI